MGRKTVIKMALLEIITAPDPRLKRKSSSIENVDDHIRRLADDLLAAMYAAPGIGLSAVQVDVPKRMLVADVSREEDGTRTPHVLINPEIVWYSDDLATYDEGCLSLPEHYAEIERPESVRIEFLDRDGKFQTMAADGLLSRCLQHEIDHFDGILFVDYLSATRRHMILRKLSKQRRVQAAE